MYITDGTRTVTNLPQGMNTFNVGGRTGRILPDGSIQYDDANYVPFSQRELQNTVPTTNRVIPNNTFNMGGRTGKLTPNGIVYDDPNYVPYSQRPLQTTVVPPRREIPQGISEPNLDDALRTKAVVNKLNSQDLAKAIIANEFGVGANRVRALANAGYSMQEIRAAQALVNQMLRR